MATKMIPEVERPRTFDEPQTQTKPERADDWFTRTRRRVKLAMFGDEEEIVIVNTTTIFWLVYHNFHALGIIDPGEERTFLVQMRGKLSVRPRQESDAVEYLVLNLTGHIQRVEIYLRRMSQELETYEMRAA